MLDFRKYNSEQDTVAVLKNVTVNLNFKNSGIPLFQWYVTIRSCNCTVEFSLKRTYVYEPPLTSDESSAQFRGSLWAHIV